MKRTKHPLVWFFGLASTLSLGLGAGAVACSSSTSTTSNSGGDGGGASDAAQGADSACGHPGDQGNEIGVGKYCGNGVSDCTGTANAKVCSVLGDPTTHFCTRTCVVDAGADQCGTGATCSCDNQGCGCVPNTCLN